MATRKKIRTKWKADRKVQLESNRRKKAIRLNKEEKASQAEKAV